MQACLSLGCVYKVSNATYINLLQVTSCTFCYNSHDLFLSSSFYLIVCDSKAFKTVIKWIRNLHDLRKHNEKSQDEISPFSRLNGDWMVAEWQLNGDGKGGFQSHFSHHSVTYQSTEWQAHFSDLSVRLFLKNKITPNSVRTSGRRIKGKVR